MYITPFYLSGSNFSGSGQNLGFLCTAKIGIVTSVPLGMCTPLIMMSFLHSLLILKDIKNNQIVDKHIFSKSTPNHDQDFNQYIL